MIEIKSKEEIKKIKHASKIVARILELLRGKIKPGANTYYLDKVAETEIRKMGAEPAFLGYKGYPATICASINEEIVHGIPAEKRILKEGDIISIDVGCLYKGFYGDAAITVGVGRIKDEKKRLLEVTKKSLEAAVSAARDGGHLGDIGFSIENIASASGMSVVRNYTGHGIGRMLHEEPSVPNYGTPGSGVSLVSGMTLALEPMICLGKSENEVKKDGWTVITMDGSPAAHFEHTIVVTKSGGEILSAI